jgi:alcohol dehydrogenase (cytochrome c)
MNPTPSADDCKSSAAYWASAVFGSILALIAAGAIAGTPDSAALLHADQDDSNWILPAKTYAGNRYSGMTQIDKDNVGSLKLAWRTDIEDDGQQETAPLIWNGTMYLSTPHDGVLALDAASGKLLWHRPYNPAYVLLYAVNRGVALAAGKVFIATLDCRLIALDAATGKTLWNVQGCRDTSNSFYSMAAYVYRNEIIVGTGGGDNGTLGLVSAFSIENGRRLWDWQTIPGPGQRGHESWPGNSWRHGGGAVWNGLAIDAATDTLFVTPGNPGPDLVMTHRMGANLYTDSIVALDISGARPRIKWYYQLLNHDTHDVDPAMIPVLFEGGVDGRTRPLVAVGDKGGNFVILDRNTGEVLHRLAVDSQVGLDQPPSLQGTKACPNHGGGIEWNGGAYDPASNSFFVVSTEECAVWKIASDDPTYVPGQLYTGGPLPKRQNGTGLLTSIDVSTGQVRWRNALPYPSVGGGVLITASGLAFASDIGGNLYAFDAKSGAQYWKTATGSSVVAPFSAYSVGGHEYLAVVVGEAGAAQTPNLPKSAGSQVLAYHVGDAPTVVNDASGQIAMADVRRNLSPTGGSPEKSIGSAPYTAAQVEHGRTVYTQQCALCHGTNLQGTSAPALTGPGFGHSHLNVSQLRTVVTQNMPLTAPASLTPEEYAAVMSYILSYDCVPPAGNGKVPFPTTESSALAKVIVGGTSCPR